MVRRKRKSTFFTMDVHLLSSFQPASVCWNTHLRTVYTVHADVNEVEVHLTDQLLRSAGLTALTELGRSQPGCAYVFLSARMRCTVGKEVWVFLYVNEDAAERNCRSAALTATSSIWVLTPFAYVNRILPDSLHLQICQEMPAVTYCTL